MFFECPDQRFILCESSEAVVLLFFSSFIFCTGVCCVSSSISPAIHQLDNATSWQLWLFFLLESDVDTSVDLSLCGLQIQLQEAILGVCRSRVEVRFQWPGKTQCGWGSGEATHSHVCLLNFWSLYSCHGKRCHPDPLLDSIQIGTMAWGLVKPLALLQSLSGSPPSSFAADLCPVKEAPVWEGEREAGSYLWQSLQEKDLHWRLTSLVGIEPWSLSLPRKIIGTLIAQVYTCLLRNKSYWVNEIYS